MLADVPLEPVAATHGDSADPVAAFAEFHGRALGATHEEWEAAISAVHAVLAHPLMARASKSKDLRREVTLTHTLADGAVLEGGDVLWRH